jgi:penicillin-binding protein 1A
VKQGKRQVGSTFKPFVYATAIMNLGMTPCSTVSNATFTKEVTFQVEEEITLKKLLLNLKTLLL